MLKVLTFKSSEKLRRNLLENLNNKKVKYDDGIKYTRMGSHD